MNGTFSEKHQKMIFPEIELHIKPNEPVTHMMLDEYFRKRIDNEIKRFDDAINKKMESLSGMHSDLQKIKKSLGIKDDPKPFMSRRKAIREEDFGDEDID